MEAFPAPASRKCYAPLLVPANAFKTPLSLWSITFLPRAAGHIVTRPLGVILRIPDLSLAMLPEVKGRIRAPFFNRGSAAPDRNLRG